MAVPDDALAEAERFCEERTPPDLRDQLRLECSARGDAITLVERRAPWNAELTAEWTTTHVAQLRRDSANGTWSLHWRGSDDRWHPYDRVRPSSDTRHLLAEIDADPTGLFWG
jgi:Protein of unknown function (DUF3024)